MKCAVIALALLATGFGCGARPEAAGERQLANQAKPAASANGLDRCCVKAIGGMDIDAMQAQTGGRTAEAIGARDKTVGHRSWLLLCRDSWHRAPRSSL